MERKNLIILLSHYADILAIPLFALTVYYFYSIKTKSPIEYALLGFSLIGLILDIVFTITFLSKKPRPSIMFS